jgi:hypothetical protein
VASNFSFYLLCAAYYYLFNRLVLLSTESSDTLFDIQLLLIRSVAIVSRASLVAVWILVFMYMRMHCGGQEWGLLGGWERIGENGWEWGNEIGIE